MPASSAGTTSMSRGAAIVALAVLGPAIGGAAGAQWQFDTVIDLGAIYTDNLRLAPDDVAESETVGFISPTFSLTNESERLRANINYRPEAFFYSGESDLNDVFHTLDAFLDTTVVRDALYLNLSAVNFQTQSSEAQFFPTTNLPISSNRVDLSVLRARPYWDQDLGFAEVYADVSYTASRYDNDQIELTNYNRDNTESRATFRLDNFSNQRGLAWGIRYEYQRFQYDESIPWDYQQAALDLGFWFNGVARVFVVGGGETSYENFFDPNMDDEFWEAGLQYRPADRLNLEIAVGERSFGDSARVDFSYELRRGSTSLTYLERPATRGQLGLDRRPLISFDNLDNFLDDPGAADRFVQKRGEWVTQIQLPKSDFSFRVFSELRDRRTNALGDPLLDQDYYGAALRWDWRMGGRSAIAITIDAAERTSEDVTSDLRRYALEYTLALSQRFSLITVLQQSTEDLFGEFAVDYVENQVQLILRTQL